MEINIERHCVVGLKISKGPGTHLNYSKHLGEWRKFK